MAVAQKKLEKREKEKAKKRREAESEHIYNIEKRAEKMDKVTAAKKGINKEFRHKMEDLGNKLEERVGGYGVKEIREAMLPPNIKAKQQSQAFLTQRNDDDSDAGASPDLPATQDEKTRTMRLGQS